jgi:UDP-GlcNAc:undecaprenyl-phosphate GlcNAc-1-phosphate transferase
MTTIITAFMLAFAVALAITPVVRSVAVRAGALDQALSSRKIHGRPIPRFGGIAVVAASFAPLVGLFFLDTGVGRLFWDDPVRAAALLAGSAAMLGLGIYDDLRGSGARTKLTVQVAVALGMWWAGYRVDHLANPFGAPIALGLLSLPFTVFWIVGVTNAVNLIDGLDGLASGVTLAAMSAIFWLAWHSNAYLMALFMAALGGSLLGFLRYNFNPASIFLGDSGSLFLGFFLATTALATSHKSPATVALLVPIVALGLPIGDTLLAMTRRAARGQSIFSADRSHVHHRLLDMGLSHRATVIVLYALCVILAGVAVGLSHADAVQTLAFGGALTGLAVTLLAATGYIKVGKASWILQVRRQNLAMRATVRSSAERLRAATSAEELFLVVRDATRALGADTVSLSFGEAVGAGGPVAYGCGGTKTREERTLSRFNLLAGQPDAGTLEVGWSDGRTVVDRDSEIAIEALCEHLRSALARLAIDRHPRIRPGAPAHGNGRAVEAEAEAIAARDLPPSRQSLVQ